MSLTSKIKEVSFVSYFGLDLRLSDRLLIWIRKTSGSKTETWEHQDGIVHFVSTQNLPKDCHSVPPYTMR